MSHRNAPLSETGRLRLARCVVDDGWSLRRAAERFQVSVSTASRWAGRYREQGESGMADRSSRPHHSPNRTPTRTERRIIGVRVTRRWGPARIGYLLGIHPSTVHRVLSRYRIAKLRWLDRATGRVVRRMESAGCGDLVHVDVKKLGKIPAGGGWRMVGRTKGNRNARADKSSGVTNKYGNPVRGYHFIHTAIDAHSRLAYSEFTRRRGQGHRRRLLAACQRVVHRLRHHRSKGVDRQRELLSITRLPRCPRRYRPSSHSALPAADQRQGGALPSHTGRRVGLCAALHQRRATLRRIPALVAHLQSPPRPHSTRRSSTSQPCT